MTRTLPGRASVTKITALGGLGLALLLSSCGDDDPSTSPSVSSTVPVDGADTVELVSLAEGVAARQSRDAVIASQAGIESADLSVAGDQPLPIDCGIGGEPYVPTAEEVALANADTDALAAAFDQYGIAYERIADDLGYAYLEWAWDDVVAQSVADSFWHDRYPPEPIPAEELDRIRAENDAIAAALDGVGATYTRHSDEQGFEWIEWDYENPTAAEAVNQVYAELYPPVPPSAEELARIRTDNDAVAAAFDAAGIAYTRKADEAGWEWLEWDWEDQAANDVANQVYTDLYPLPDGGPDACILPLEGDPAVEEPAVDGDDIPAPEPTVEEGDDSVSSPGVDEPIDGGYTPEQEAQRASDVAALEAGFTAAGVEYETRGEAPWAAVVFDIAAPAAPGVDAEILAGRG